jgi:hypothetical protein
VHSIGPRTGLGYSPCDAVACHAWLAEKTHGPRPGSPVQWGKRVAAGDVACAHQARSWRGHHARDGAVAHVPAARWWLAGSKVLSASTSGTPGWRRTRRRGQERTREVGRWRGGANSFVRWHSMAARELRWPALMKVWPCSSEKEGRAEVVP